MLEDDIMTELKKFSLKRNSLGYEYLVEAIKIVSTDKLAVKDFKRNVYLPIAEEYNTKPQNIFWCINKILNLMCFNTDKSILVDYFKIGEEDTLTTKTFIIGVAKKINQIESINLK